MNPETASRSNSTATRAVSGTACPPRRSFVASDARRRGQACQTSIRNLIAFGVALPTPAMLASVDNARRFTVIVDAGIR